MAAVTSLSARVSMHESHGESCSKGVVFMRVATGRVRKELLRTQGQLPPRFNDLCCADCTGCLAVCHPRRQQAGSIPLEWIYGCLMGTCRHILWSKVILMWSLCHQVERLLATSAEWQFDMFKLHEATRGHSLSVMSYFLFSSSNLIKELDLNPAALARYEQLHNKPSPHYIAPWFSSTCIY